MHMAVSLSTKRNETQQKAEEILSLPVFYWVFICFKGKEVINYEVTGGRRASKGSASQNTAGKHPNTQCGRYTGGGRSLWNGNP